MPGTEEFAKLVPGFDFLQGLMKSAGQSLPAVNQWIAPTLDPQEIERRIEQLRTVQFWLEQNAKLLATTIQALEVQRMTLATLKTMNMPMDSLREAFTMKPAPVAPPAAAPAPAPKPPRAKPAAASAASAAPAAPGVDPMQWWGALTQQFTELAANAMRETSAEAAKTFGAAATAPAQAPAAKTAAVRKRKAAPER